MQTALAFHDPTTLATPLLAVFAVDISTQKDELASPAVLTTHDAIASAASRWLTSGEFKAELGETLLLHAPEGVRAERILIVGLGKAAKLSTHELRKGAGTAVRFAQPRGIRSLALAFPEETALADEPANPLPCELAARALAEGAIVGDFTIDTYRSDRKSTALEALTVVSASTEKSTQAQIRSGFGTGVIVGESQNFARELINEPGNILTPTELGRRAEAMAAEVGLASEVHSTDTLRELKMGAFLAVAQGSAEPPALIVLRYTPKRAKPSAPLLGLVGKGITFDTGGISIKPADGMDKMKYDMGGAAAMLGAMRAIALLQPDVPVLAVICSCENMPGSRAYKPGDVLTAMSGTTIEVLNTDAEGRLVLADGLHYAKTLGATHLLNAATLTGAIGVALGYLNAGVFTNDDAAVERFLSVYETAGEKFWQMPCTDDYRAQIRSQIADIMNTGGTRYGGAISAAMFLKEFAGDTPWLHLDIANTAWIDDNKAWISQGPSGIGVRSVLEWVRTFAS